MRSRPLYTHVALPHHDNLSPLLLPFTDRIAHPFQCPHLCSSQIKDSLLKDKKKMENSALRQKDKAHRKFATQAKTEKMTVCTCVFV
jgi:hypothetical protein